MVRILCIHGGGSSGKIFESQTVALRELLPSHWQWVFVNSEIECGPHPQFEEVYPGPFFTSTVVPSIVQMRATQEWILDIIDEEGPFDGLFGFSAGFYNGLGLLHYLQKHEPTRPPVFRFLAGFGGNVPYSGDPDEGIDVTDWVAFHRAHDTTGASIEELKAFSAWAINNQDKRPHPMDTTGISPIFHPIMAKFVSPVFNRKMFESKLLHPDVTSIRVKVPTVHIIGKKDDVLSGAKNMMELCDARQRLVYIHEGGHEVPRGKTDLLRIKDLIEKAVHNSTMMS